MKTKLLLILFLIITACSNEELSQEQQDCNCGTIVEKIFFSGVAPFTILKIKNNCTGQIMQIELDGNVGTLNGQYCND